ncbi:MAG: hypothetical protein DWQ02_24775 [Bacteroidetes bacterium]|nr:MAG: hypothetical protein DWQ02_24775 [Bacteroidota bacterium]
MRLTTTCHYCENELRLAFSHPDKDELIKEKGDLLDLTCHHCHQEGQYPVKDLKAKEERKVILIAFVIMLLPSWIMGLMLWEEIFLSSIIYNVLAVILLSLVPYLLYLELKAQERLDTHNFNHQ